MGGPRLDADEADPACAGIVLEQAVRVARDTEVPSCESGARLEHTDEVARDTEAPSCESGARFPASTSGRTACAVVYDPYGKTEYATLIAS